MKKIPDVRKLHEWYGQNARKLPWRKKNPDPHHIMVSEFVLQQTQVKQGLPYYERFVKRFPTVRSLAGAELGEVLKVWEGCGYYARARNLHAAAKKIMEKHDGWVPSDYDELLSLPGIGPYLAAAISSIAYGKRRAVLDANVMRVIARVEALREKMDEPKTKKKMQKIAQGWLDACPDAPASTHNQAMMELGALVCTPRNPKCQECPLQKDCRAFAKGKMEQYPRKGGRKARPLIHAAVGFLVRNGSEVLIAKRREDDFLGGLWEFPGGKIEKGEGAKEALAREFEEETGLRVRAARHALDVVGEYTHRRILMHAYVCQVRRGERGKARPLQSSEVRWEKIAGLAKKDSPYAFAKANRAMIGWLNAEYGKNGV